MHKLRPAHRAKIEQSLAKGKDTRENVGNFIATLGGILLESKDDPAYVQQIAADMVSAKSEWTDPLFVAD